VVVVGHDFAFIHVQSFFFVATHEVDVELGDANFAEAVELFAVLVDGADDAEAVDDFVADKLGIVAADFAVVEIVILAAVFDERSESRRQFLGLYLEMRSIT